VSVHETIPFKNPALIRLKISNISNAKLGEAAFIIEVNVDKNTNMDKILEQLKESLPEKAKIKY
jgi:RNA binding exosome subunit